MVEQFSVLDVFVYPLGTVIFTVSVLEVFTLTVAKDDGLVELIVPISIEGVVTTPLAATAKPVIVISLQAKVGTVSGWVAVAVQATVLPALKYPVGTVMFTVNVLTVSTLTVLNEEGLVEAIVPALIVGKVTVPFAATANPVRVTSEQVKVGVAD